MSEEKRQKAELNEAALEGVSGGDAIYNQMIEKIAEKMCSTCGPGRLHFRCNGGSQAKLRNYMIENGPIDKFMDCPYYPK